MEHPILTEKANQIGYITLNRPAKRNALSPELILELEKAFAAFENDAQVKVVILKSEGKAFCAGADLDYIQRMQHFSYEENLEDSKLSLHKFRGMLWREDVVW